MSYNSDSERSEYAGKGFSNESNRLRLLTLGSSAKMNKIKYRTKGYIHFDNKKSIDKVMEKIQDPQWVAKHGFYPFIHFEIKFQKYSKKLRKSKEKIRKIFYASHLDSFIYKYYGDTLNNHYNGTVEDLGIDNVATAYRNNLSGKSNIHFAKEVIDFIKKQENAYIFVADFTNFFDTLDHRYLKEKIRSVLKVATLPPDYYNVFKNITKFSYIMRKDIEEELKQESPKNQTKNRYKYFSEQEFRGFKHKKLFKNTKSYGIPQGAGISSVFSNIYLLDFDKEIKDYVEKHNGLYRRYCDDLIIIIPIKGNIENYDFQSHKQFLEDVKNRIPKLEIQPEKTGNYFYTNNKILSLDLNETKLDYLGFSFNGNEVRIREKSLFKYYTRTYRKIRICNRKSRKFGRKSYRRGLYKNYSHLGKNKKGHGNFLSYVTRAQNAFDEDSSTVNLMEAQVKNHWKRIKLRLEDPKP